MKNNNTTNYINRDFTKPRDKVILNPWQITGFTDGEGSFNCSIIKTDNGKMRVKLEFKITQKSHSEGILFLAQAPNIKLFWMW